MLTKRIMKFLFLEPIALTPRIITTPIVDNFAYDTFEYRKIDDGGRGIFNWNLHFRRFPRRPQDSLILDAPIPNPVMVGLVMEFTVKSRGELSEIQSLTKKNVFEKSQLIPLTKLPLTPFSNKSQQKKGFHENSCVGWICFCHQPSEFLGSRLVR